MYNPVTRRTSAEGPWMRCSTRNSASHSRACAFVLARRRLTRPACSIARPAKMPSAPTMCRKSDIEYMDEDPPIDRSVVALGRQGKRVKLVGVRDREDAVDPSAPGFEDQRRARLAALVDDKARLAIDQSRLQSAPERCAGSRPLNDESRHCVRALDRPQRRARNLAAAVGPQRDVFRQHADQAVDVAGTSCLDESIQ